MKEYVVELFYKDDMSLARSWIVECYEPEYAIKFILDAKLIDWKRYYISVRVKGEK